MMATEEKEERAIDDAPPDFRKRKNLRGSGAAD